VAFSFIGGEKYNTFYICSTGDSDFDLIFAVLMPLSAIFQLYHGDQF